MRKPFSDLSQKQYAAIGKVACEWSHLDLMLRDYIERLANVSESTAAKIATDLGSMSLMHMILALAHNESKAEDDQPPIYQHLNALQHDIHKLRGERNTVVHGAWLKAKPGLAIALKADAKGKLSRAVVKKNIDEMEETAGRITAMHDKLIEVLHDLQNGQLQPLPPKSPRQSKRDRRNSRTTQGKASQGQP